MEFSIDVITAIQHRTVSPDQEMLIRKTAEREIILSRHNMTVTRYLSLLAWSIYWKHDPCFSDLARVFEQQLHPYHAMTWENMESHRMITTMAIHAPLKLMEDASIAPEDIKQWTAQFLKKTRASHPIQEEHHPYPHPITNVYCIEQYMLDNRILLSTGQVPFSEDDLATIVRQQLDIPIWTLSAALCHHRALQKYIDREDIPQTIQWAIQLHKLYEHPESLNDAPDMPLTGSTIWHVIEAMQEHIDTTLRIAQRTHKYNDIGLQQERIAVLQTKHMNIIHTLKEWLRKKDTQAYTQYQAIDEHIQQRYNLEKALDRIPENERASNTRARLKFEFDTETPTPKPLDTQGLGL